MNEIKNSQNQSQRKVKKSTLSDLRVDINFHKDFFKLNPFKSAVNKLGNGEDEVVVERVLKQLNCELNHADFLQQLNLSNRTSIYITLDKKGNDLSFKATFTNKSAFIDLNKQLELVSKIEMKRSRKPKKDETVNSNRQKNRIINSSRSSESKKSDKELIEFLKNQLENSNKQIEVLTEQIAVLNRKLDAAIMNKNERTNNTNNNTKRNGVKVNNENSAHVNNHHTVNNRYAPQRTSDLSSHTHTVIGKNVTNNVDAIQNSSWADLCDERLEPDEKNIFVANVVTDSTNAQKVIQWLNSIGVLTEDFKVFPMKSNQQRFVISSVLPTQFIIDELNKIGVCCHAFSSKNEAIPCFIIKNINHNYLLNEIEDELVSLGFKPVKISYFTTNRQKSNNIMSSMIKVILSPGADTSDFEKIRFMFNTKVYVEKMRAGVVVQCKNCQLLNHTSRFCRRPFRCVKCIDPHGRGEECKVNELNQIPPQCVNCKGDHIASDFSCPVIQEFISKSKKSQAIINKMKSKTTEAAKIKPNVSFAEAISSQTQPISSSPLKGRASYHPSSPNENKEKLLAESVGVFKQSFVQFERIISLLLNSNG